MMTYLLKDGDYQKLGRQVKTLLAIWVVLVTNPAVSSTGLFVLAVCVVPHQFLHLSS